jgi:flagellar hook assembly protein FlgD
VISSIPQNTFTTNTSLENYPNPFCNKTVIRYTVSEVSQVNIKIIDINGKLIKNLIDLERVPGTYTVEWNAGTNSPGIYTLIMHSGSNVTAKRMLLIMDR